MKKLILVGLLAMTSLAHAGGESVGGGDECEKRIQEIRDDIYSWITNAGSEQLQNLPVSHQEYSKRMAEVLKISAQSNGSIKPVTKIECTSESIQVQGVEKTCRFDNSEAGLKITCNNERFLNKSLMSEDNQYRLIHHEYAGLAGLENPHDADSAYTISDQISSFLEVQTIKKLGIKKNGNLSLGTSKKVPVWIKAETLLVKEAAVAVSASTSCAVKTNVLGQVYILSRAIQAITLGNSSYNQDVYPLAVLLESYGVNSRFKEACTNTDQASFNKVVELLQQLNSKIDQ